MSCFEYEYADTTTVDSRWRTRTRVAVVPVDCPGCEGEGFVAWFTCRAWPTPHELPISRQDDHPRRCIFNHSACASSALHLVGRPRPCRYCRGTGLWGGSVKEAR